MNDLTPRNMHVFARAIRMYALGTPQTEIAKELDVCTGTVARWLDSTCAVEALAEIKEAADVAFALDLVKLQALLPKASSVLEMELDRTDGDPDRKLEVARYIMDTLLGMKSDGGRRQVDANVVVQINNVANDEAEREIFDRESIPVGCTATVNEILGG